MKEHQIRALEQGLAAFDAAQASRRRRRRTLAAALVLAVAGSTTAIAFWPPATGTPSGTGAPAAPATPGTIVAAARRPLPAYVHLIEDSTQLALELEEANACERVGRRGDRVYIVECTGGAP